MAAEKTVRTDRPRVSRAIVAASLVTTATLSTIATVDASEDITLQPRAGQPLSGLTPEQMERFIQGQLDYNTPLLEEEGLGPVFNKEHCGNCHAVGNILGGPGSQTVTRFGVSGKKGFDPLEDWGGSLLQAESINEDCAEEVPDFAFTELRVTNGMLGYGLVEAIADQDIIDLDDVTDMDGDGISGKVHMVEAFEDGEGAPLRAGRFGWKAQVATILTFSADAALNEMGLTNRFLQVENDPNGVFEPAIEDCDNVADPEDGPDSEGRDFIDRVTDFQRFLAAPPQTPKSGMTGETVFLSIGCGQCHVPEYTTQSTKGLEDAIASKTIRPYSDFLLHDMGTAGDPIVQGDADTREVKTPPLWGVRFREPLLHNGAANAGTLAGRLAQVIEAHGALFSEAAASAAAYEALSGIEKDQVLAFLDSLGRAEYDTDGDNDVDMGDFHGFGVPEAFSQCFGGGPYTADDACAVHDVNQDGAVDAIDAEYFMHAYAGPRRDCNGNGIVDLIDIVNGDATDADFNGIPDACQPTCTNDTNGDGTIDTIDLLNLLGEWGECGGPVEPCNADFNLDGTVDTIDLLDALGAWGPCGP